MLYMGTVWIQQSVGYVRTTHIFGTVIVWKTPTNVAVAGIVIIVNKVLELISKKS